jgi:hypothetical protein
MLASQFLHYSDPVKNRTNEKGFSLAIQSGIKSVTGECRKRPVMRCSQAKSKSFFITFRPVVAFAVGFNKLQVTFRPIEDFNPRTSAVARG